MQAGIYAITNISDKKVYVGSTVNLKKRMRDHRSMLLRDAHGNPHLQRAWNKYGESVFEFGVLEYLDNQEELISAEQFWMDNYRLEGRDLYNCGLAASHPLLGISPSKETRRKISAAGKNRVVTKETRCRISESNKGKSRTKEHCQRNGIIHSKDYPTFFHRGTGEILPAGRNLSALCRRLDLDPSAMGKVAHGKAYHHKGWILK